MNNDIFEKNHECRVIKKGKKVEKSGNIRRALLMFLTSKKNTRFKKKIVWKVWGMRVWKKKQEPDFEKKRPIKIRNDENRREDRTKVG